MPPNSKYRPSTRHADLGPEFFDAVTPADFPRFILRHRNQTWAERVGLGTLTDAEWIDHFGRFAPLPGNLPAPLALRYHGHQFRAYNPDLGDGRGFLFAQLFDSADGRLLDLGTKGSGTTPWSRQGDGRLTLKGGVREVLATSLLEALGVNTSKSFSLIETGESLYRGDEPSPTRASVLVRLSHSHIRIGTFQRLAYRGETENVARLIAHSVETYLPEAADPDAALQAAKFFSAVLARVAATGGQWMAAGFVHGVLNTDNINITGESFDYGPWRFLPTYDPGFTAAYFDQTGLYAYGRQPETLLWNLARLAECLLPLVEKSVLEERLAAFWPALQAAFAEAVLAHLGLAPRDAQRDLDLARGFATFLHDSRAPFEQAFFDWAGGLESAARAAESPSAEFYAGEAFAPVRDLLSDYRPSERLDLSSPVWRRRQAVTLLIEEVEALWAPIAERDDWREFEAKIADIAELSSALGNDRMAAR
jgi:serine/tyrosine/threonine adenylyltransferase